MYKSQEFLTQTPTFKSTSPSLISIRQLDASPKRAKARNFTRITEVKQVPEVSVSGATSTPHESMDDRRVQSVLSKIEDMQVQVGPNIETES